MKTRTTAIAMALCFFSCALFAQNKHDTVPQTRTDTMHRADTSSRSADTSKVSAFVIHHQNFESSTPFIEKNRSAAKENEITFSAK